ncbi:hypothetical protein F183_A12460 [Bryobacterales bacterium F-183]|nr:hypothetical protein F183_A12460 [Bryobacterales bacterium F-183]
MKLKSFIQERIRQRLTSTDSLVVYDPDRRYRDLVLELAGNNVCVVDACESTIKAREEAMSWWLQMGEKSANSGRLLVYVPSRKPATDEARQKDPFQPFALGGDAFPHGDGDSYQALCLSAKPDFQSAIDDLFRHGATPSFEMVDALDASANWPQLRTLLKCESTKEIVVALLNPSSGQHQALTSDGSWIGEYKQFAQQTLGLSAHAQLSTWEDLREELARFVLFSEFALDLPSGLPPALESVPHADQKRREMIYAVCDTLRDSQSHQDTYMVLARQVNTQLKLEKHMPADQNYGERDTFAFEERHFLRQCAKSIAAGDLAKADEIIEGRQKSVWVRANDRGISWTIARRGLQVVQAIRDGRRESAGIDSDLSALLRYYIDHGRRVDALYRQFERTVQDSLGDADGLEKLIETARRQYRDYSDALQKRFVASVRSEGWPIPGFDRQTQIFDRYVSTAIERKERVAYFLLDGLRFELAAEMLKDLPASCSAKLDAALAQVPTITPVGMAALMPGAEGKLFLAKAEATLVPRIGDATVRLPQDREAHIKAAYGDRAKVVTLDDLLKAKRPTIDQKVNLLVVRNKDIDQAGEMMQGFELGLMQKALEKVLRALRVVQDLEFRRAILATDHGFLFLGEELPGDKVLKPEGKWLLEKERCLIGAGGAGQGTVRFTKSDLSVPGDFEDIVVPETWGTFQTGSTYMHSGLSLQECVLPVVTIEFGPKVPTEEPASFQLQYRGAKSGSVTTRRPMIEVSMFQADLFGSSSVQFRLVARAGKKEVGEAAPSEHVDPTSGIVKIEAGQAIKVPLRMKEDFSGEFTVTAVDPVTQVTLDTLTLRTDYLE